MENITISKKYMDFWIKGSWEKNCGNGSDLAWFCAYFTDEDGKESQSYFKAYVSKRIWSFSLLPGEKKVLRISYNIEKEYFTITGIYASNYKLPTCRIPGTFKSTVKILDNYHFENGVGRERNLPRNIHLGYIAEVEIPGFCKSPLEGEGRYRPIPAAIPFYDTANDGKLMEGKFTERDGRIYPWSRSKLRFVHIPKGGVPTTKKMVDMTQEERWEND